MKTDFKDMKHQRVYIKNFINRRFIGEKQCAVCSSNENLSVIHNKENPYQISFICRDCKSKLTRKDLENLPKVDILKNIEVNKRYSHSKDLILDSKMKFIVEHSLETDLSMMNYLKSHNISYHRFKIATKIYEKEVAPIEKDIKNHFKRLRVKNISKTKTSE